MKSYHLLVTGFAGLTAILSAQCTVLSFYKEVQTSVDATMVFDYVETASVLACAINCNGVANCTGLVYCQNDNKCSILTAVQPSAPISVPYPTCKAFSEVMTSSQTSPSFSEVTTSSQTSPSFSEVTTSSQTSPSFSEVTTSSQTSPSFSEVTTSSQTSQSCQNGRTSHGAPCQCPAAFTGRNCETRMEDCPDVALYVGNSPGTYTVWPTKAAQPFDVECRGVTTMIMFRERNTSGCETVPVTYLDVPWADYKSGFRHSNCYMWLGLEKMHALTSVRPYKAFIRLKIFYTVQGEVSYNLFSVGDEASEYQLSVSGFTAHNAYGDRFNLCDPATTLDGSHFCAKDHCINSADPCAEWHGGAWWNRLDVCQTNPHQRSDIYWVLTNGSTVQCTDTLNILSFLSAIS